MPSTCCRYLSSRSSWLWEQPNIWSGNSLRAFMAHGPKMECGLMARSFWSSEVAFGRRFWRLQMQIRRKEKHWCFTASFSSAFKSDSWRNSANVRPMSASSRFKKIDEILNVKVEQAVAVVLPQHIWLDNSHQQALKKLFQFLEQTKGVNIFSLKKFVYSSNVGQDWMQCRKTRYAWFFTSRYISFRSRTL